LRALLSEPQKRNTYRIILIPAAATAILLGVIVYFFFLPSKPVVGMLEWQTAPGYSENITAKTQIQTGENTAFVTFPEESRLEFGPETVFSVLSSSTGRTTEPAVVLLERGTLEASVTKLLSHQLIVITPDVEVKVVGTRFIIRVSDENVFPADSSIEETE
ncbi:MAG: FecR domain-containing protein, partial [bacterium]